jgi:phage-related minor tail protein
MVGERGPELFVPHSSGSIVANNKLAGGGGGSTNNIVVNVNMENGSVNATDGNRLGVLVGNIVKGELVKQTRPGGLLAA